ncbi:MAG: hypothetical protein LUD19_05015, partial [Clostridia bacterium]|nr:hypothetical protein [Clostridia bacterium]
LDIIGYAIKSALKNVKSRKLQCKRRKMQCNGKMESKNFFSDKYFKGGKLNVSKDEKVFQKTGSGGSRFGAGSQRRNVEHLCVGC